ncbi:MAG TPA: hypothetical protein VFZ00_28750 [Solirubrobacter sp.]|nr:hypothetical protein [Solirubrobacter sp.]
MRVTFAGPAPQLAAHIMHAPAGGVEPRLVDVRAGAEPAGVREEILRGAPHAVVALGVPAAALEDLPAVTLGLGESSDGCDRVLGAPGATRVWRARPLPVDDRLYADVRPPNGRPRALCLSRSTGRREDLLVGAKHGHDLVHYTHGLSGDALSAALAATDVGITVAAQDTREFAGEALVHLAAGQLLLAEPFVPPCGLEAGIDYVPVTTRDDISRELTRLGLRPDAYERVRIRGRLKAEEHRASLVWPRLIHDLLEDIRVFGRRRPADF